VAQFDVALAAMLRSIMTEGDYTFLLLGAGATAEVVVAHYSETQNWTVERAAAGSTLRAHASGEVVSFILTPAAVANEVSVPGFSIVPRGLITLVSQSSNEATIEVPYPEFQGHGIAISGSWPALNFSLVQDDTGCCGSSTGGSSAGGITSLFGNGLAVVAQSGSTASITVAPPSFTGTGITITGDWPNVNFEADGSAGGVESVTAGVGIVVTGTPGQNPVVNLQATGVTAGTYGGLVVNAYGQFTAIDPTFNPPSTITSDGIINAVRVGNVLTLSIDAAAEGVVGVVALADADNPLDPADRTTAVTPALLASVIDALAGATVAGFSTYSPEATALYTNIVSASPIAIDLAAGENMLVHAHITMLDTAAPLTPVAFGMGIFNSSAALIQANRSMTQSQQSMTALLTGPLSTGLVLATTAVPSGSSVVSSSMTAIKF
jgi:hypothetical protein